MDGAVYLGLTQRPTSISLAFCLCAPLLSGEQRMRRALISFQGVLFSISATAACGKQKGGGDYSLRWTS